MANERPNATARARITVRTAFFIVLFVSIACGTGLHAWQKFGEAQLERQRQTGKNALLAHALSQSTGVFLRAAMTGVQTLALEAAVRPLTAAQLQPLVRRFAEAQDDAFLSMYVIGLDGVEIADFQPSGKTDDAKTSGVGVNLADRPYFRAVIDGKRGVISETVIGRSTKRPVVVVAAPVLNAAGDVIAVAAGSLDLTLLSEVGMRAAADDTVVPVVVDAGGHVVAHSDFSQVTALRNMSGSEPVERSLEGRSGVTAPYIDSDGVSYVAAYETVEGFGWGVWIAQDERLLRSSVQAAQLRAWIALLAQVGLIGMCFAVASRFRND